MPKKPMSRKPFTLTLDEYHSQGHTYRDFIGREQKTSWDQDKTYHARILFWAIVNGDDPPARAVKSNPYLWDLCMEIEGMSYTHAPSGKKYTRAEKQNLVENKRLRGIVRDYLEKLK